MHMMRRHWKNQHAYKTCSFTGTDESGIVNNIRCTPYSNPYKVILSRAPSQPLSTAWDAVVRANYQLVLHDDLDRDSYIVTSKEPADNPLSNRLTCINYTDKYYQNDKDFINGLIT